MERDYAEKLEEIIGSRIDYFQYSQSSGNFYAGAHGCGRALMYRGYSGHGEYINDPDAEAKVARGPIPRGVWKMARAFRHKNLGPLAIPLSPVGHTAYGRSEFFIHGDNNLRNRSASQGCIILPRFVREAIDARFGAALEVVL